MLHPKKIISIVEELGYAVAKLSHLGLVRTWITNVATSSLMFWYSPQKFRFCLQNDLPTLVLGVVS